MKFTPRQLVTIDRPVVDQNERGEDVTAWSRVAPVWADLKQLAGREREAAMQVSAETTWRAYIRYAPGLIIEPEYRLMYGSRVFSIVSVTDLNEAHQVIQIDLKESPL